MYITVINKQKYNLTNCTKNQKYFQWKFPLINFDKDFFFQAISNFVLIWQISQ